MQSYGVRISARSGAGCQRYEPSRQVQSQHQLAQSSPHKSEEPQPCNIDSNFIPYTILSIPPHCETLPSPQNAYRYILLSHLGNYKNQRRAKALVVKTQKKRQVPLPLPMPWYAPCPKNALLMPPINRTYTYGFLHAISILRLDARTRPPILGLAHAQFDLLLAPLAAAIVIVVAIALALAPLAHFAGSALHVRTAGL